MKRQHRKRSGEISADERHRSAKERRAAEKKTKSERQKKSI
jgi:hypothetical protein